MDVVDALICVLAEESRSRLYDINMALVPGVEKGDVDGLGAPMPVLVGEAEGENPLMRWPC